MNEIYIEVQIAPTGAIFVFNWTHAIEFALARQSEWQFERMHNDWLPRFVAVRGKHTIYWISGLGNHYERCKQFANWYHVRKKNFSMYRLD
jgi:hypothetical protein